MPAFELFPATTTDLFIANIKAKAEAYGWIVDFFGTYLAHNRLHLHNSAGSHFEIWYQNGAEANIRGCTGYSSGDIPTAQPGVSSNVRVYSNYWHLVVVGPSSITIKGSYSSSYWIVQFGAIIDKVGGWSGGTCISGATTSTGYDLWIGYEQAYSQVLINGSWSTSVSGGGGGVKGICESELYTKMPFAYSGGIMPVPMLLVQLNATTPSNLHPIGYAPDFRSFNGGDVYESLTPITLDGESWLPFSRFELGTVLATTTPDTLIRLAA